MMLPPYMFWVSDNCTFITRVNVIASAQLALRKSVTHVTRRSGAAFAGRPLSVSHPIVYPPRSIPWCAALQVRRHFKISQLLNLISLI
jgi:hypothetical protein